MFCKAPRFPLKNVVFDVRWMFYNCYSIINSKIDTKLKWMDEVSKMFKKLTNPVVKMVRHRVDVKKDGTKKAILLEVSRSEIVKFYNKSMGGGRTRRLTK
ncbi:hypothetical protein AVEN_99751-1 [Araneus ventricosus]|uniref:Uncharacterized protein n=1 Tax=Araneus ventricosus TaxID=182803 RepID=A0A4Y2DKY3_ARAVE|nr:hypothetical protein AVEN_99751-1 [Araneus ventricosus]